MKSCLKRFRHSGLEKCGTVQKLHPSFIFFHPEYTVAFTSAPENARGINEINILVPLEKMLHFLLKIKKLVGTGHSISMGQSKKNIKRHYPLYKVLSESYFNLESQECSM